MTEVRWELAQRQVRSPRFGLVYVDFNTQQRTPKQSAQYFRETAARNAVVQG